MPDDITPPDFRVPREDRSLLAIPRLNSAAGLVESNRALFAETSCSFHGRSLAEMRTATRAIALSTAREYTSTLLQTDLIPTTSDSLIVGGHQPELFHVGVWAKNFTLAGIAQKCGSTALNLVIDNDTLNDTTIRVPVGTRETISTDRVAFDTPRPTLPWEEALLLNRSTFEGFGATVQSRVRSAWNFNPLIGAHWGVAVRQMAVSKRLCDGLTALRTSVEHQWGLQNLELPLSRLSETEPFLWFVAHLLMRLPELQDVYNSTVADYRLEHQLRNHRQPVPDLEAIDGWREAPFWIWKRTETQRGRLFVRRIGSICELRGESDVLARIPDVADGPLDPAVAVLRQLPAAGIRLRPRALMTTLFARVCLADLFVHGIGGAKYDAMTDRLCERLLGLPAPRFLTVSATLHLPLGPQFPANEGQLQEINRQIRDLTYNPDRHLPHEPATAGLIAEKNDVLAAAKTLRGSNRLRGKLTPDQHRRLEAIRTELRSLTKSLRAEYEARRATIRSQLSANTLIRNREYAFILYPEEHVRQFLMPLAHPEWYADGA